MTGGTRSGTPADASADRRLAAEGLVASEWSNGPEDRYLQHRHDYDKVIVVADGDITFGCPEIHRTIRLVAGDRLNLPTGSLHDAIVGDAGVRCLEAHLPPGTLEPAIFHFPGWVRWDS
jgi:hypothetical protein